MEITSVRNPLLQKIRKAVLTGRTTEDGLMVAEGPRLVDEALSGKWRISSLVITPAGRAKYADLVQAADAEIVEIPAKAFESTSGTQHSQQILALLQPPAWNWEEVCGRHTLIVALDGIQDPGNAGTIVRSAEAFGATGVVFLKGCAHVANGKLLRASAGSIFRMPFLEGISASDFLFNVRARELTLYALQARAEAPITAADLTRPLVLLAGNEGSGISNELLARAKAVSIPTIRVESVNVAVASSVALFAVQQQRGAA